PLAGEVADQRGRPRIAEHPDHLPLLNTRLAQLSPSGQVDQFIVGHAAPEKEGEARGELDVADGMGWPSRTLHRIALDTEEEVRIDQHRADRELDALVEAALAAARPVVDEQPLDVVRIDGTAESPSGKGAEDFPSARLLIARGGRRADEDARPARRLVRPLRIVGTADLEAVDAHRRIAVPGVFVGADRQPRLERSFWNAALLWE